MLDYWLNSLEILRLSVEEKRIYLPEEGIDLAGKKLEEYNIQMERRIRHKKQKAGDLALATDVELTLRAEL